MKYLICLFACISALAVGCPTPAPSPLPTSDVVAGTIEGAAFRATSFTAEHNSQGFLVVTVADYQLACGSFAPPTGTAARRIVVGFDEGHQHTGTLRLELPDVSEVQASAIVYDGDDSSPRSLVIRRGQIDVQTLTGSQISGTLQLDEPSASVSLSGPFDVPICGSSP